jgi:hypothetical protein
METDSVGGSFIIHRPWASDAFFRIKACAVFLSLVPLTHTAIRLDEYCYESKERTIMLIILEASDQSINPSMKTTNTSCSIDKCITYPSIPEGVTVSQP